MALLAFPCPKNKAETEGFQSGSHQGLVGLRKVSFHGKIKVRLVSYLSEEAAKEEIWWTRPEYRNMKARDDDLVLKSTSTSTSTSTKSTWTSPHDQDSCCMGSQRNLKALHEHEDDNHRFQGSHDSKLGLETEGSRKRRRDRMDRAIHSILEAQKVQRERITLTSASSLSPSSLSSSSSSSSLDSCFASDSSLTTTNASKKQTDSIGSFDTENDCRNQHLHHYHNHHSDLFEDFELYSQEAAILAYQRGIKLRKQLLYTPSPSAPLTSNGEYRRRNNSTGIGSSDSNMIPSSSLHIESDLFTIHPTTTPHRLRSRWIAEDFPSSSASTIQKQAIGNSNSMRNRNSTNARTDRLGDGTYHRDSLMLLTVPVRR